MCILMSILADDLGNGVSKMHPNHILGTFSGSVYLFVISLCLQVSALQTSKVLVFYPTRYNNL